mmetsp:Transcript_15269/g.21591  ORF Transcript_15269/g.21591 Transcript_15269/m.21591 type:complete len:842 (+) Transcript_15269:156-2681(+)
MSKTRSPKIAKCKVEAAELSNKPQQNVNNAVLEQESSSSEEPSLVIDVTRLRGPGAPFENGDFTLQPCRMPPLKEMQPVQKFVASALLADQRSRQYLAVMDCIRKCDDPPMLRKIFIALRTAGSTLHHMTKDPNQHPQLIHVLFKIDPFVANAAVTTSDNEKLIAPIQDGSLADAYYHLIVALVSANSVFVGPILNGLWRILKRVPAESEDSIMRSTKTHACIATIIRVCPKGTTELYPLVAGSFPFRLGSATLSLWYTEQALTVTGYAQSIRSKILALVIDKCLEVDVEIKINDVGEVTIENEAKDNKDPDGDNGNESKKDAPDGSSPNKGKVTDIKVDDLADKLDQMMEYLLEYVHRLAKSHPDAAQDLFRIVSPVFDNVILTTHRSKYVQFVVMVICGLGESPVESSSGEADAAPVTDIINNTPSTPSSTTTEGQPIPQPKLYRGFCHKLVGILIDSCRSMSTRQCAACYLASFISRSSFVCPETIVECITALFAFAETYILELKMKGDDIHAADARDQCDLHALFYTVCQAAFYIMCFRGKEAVQYYNEGKEVWLRSKEDPNQGEVVPDVIPPSFDIGPERWTKLCSHELQPMRYCLESVRGEFLHVAHVFDLLDAQLLERLVSEDRRMATASTPVKQPLKKAKRAGKIIKKKKRASAITTAVTLEKQRHKGGVGGLGRGSNPLDSFFPFDPYLLRRSYPLIEPFYKNWEGSVEKEVSLEQQMIDEEEQEDTNVGLPTENDSDDDNDSDDENSDGDSDSSDDDDDDDDEDEDDDHGPLQNSVSSNLRNMSISPPNSIRPGADITSPASRSSRREEQRQLWANTLKRARAPSVDDGSW